MQELTLLRSTSFTGEGCFFVFYANTLYPGFVYCTHSSVSYCNDE